MSTARHPSGTLAQPARRRARDVRMLAVASLVLTIAGLAYLVTLMPGRGVEAVLKPPPAAQSRGSVFGGLQANPNAAAPNRIEEALVAEPPIDPRVDPHGHVRQARAAQAAKLLAEGVAHFDAGRYAEAVEVLDRAGQLDPENPLAYLHMGRALMGLENYPGAHLFFERAVDLDPRFAEAYFGYAEASEALGDLESALGGMRSFLHLVGDADPYRLPVAQARSAIWEWEAKLGRGPWGPTRGIPPGFTAEEIKRDGRGVAVKVPRPETLREDGTMDYEIKAGDRFPELFKP